MTNLLIVGKPTGKGYMDYSQFQTAVALKYFNNAIHDPFIKLDITNIMDGHDARLNHYLTTLDAPDESEDTVYDMVALFCHLVGAINRNIWLKVRGRDIDVDATLEKLKYHLQKLNLPLP